VADQPIAMDYYIPLECLKLSLVAAMNVMALRLLGHHELAEQESDRLEELQRRSGPSECVVIITGSGKCHTRITQTSQEPLALVLGRAFPSA